MKDEEERKAYYREYNKAWYQKHRGRLLEKHKQHKSELREWLKCYKDRLRCKECGESHPACLQFHHRNKATKSFNISAALKGTEYISLKKLEEEITKCDILCGNCHALHHWKEAHDFDNWLEVLPLTEQDREDG